MKKIYQETGRKIREKQIGAEIRKTGSPHFKSRGLYSADVSGQLLADFSSRRLQQLLQQRYKVTARIHILESQSLRFEVLFRCLGFSYTAEFLSVIFAAKCSLACIFKPQRTPNCAVLFQAR